MVQNNVGNEVVKQEDIDRIKKDLEERLIRLGVKDSVTSISKDGVEFQVQTWYLARGQYQNCKFIDPNPKKAADHVYKTIESYVDPSKGMSIPL